MVIGVRRRPSSLSKDFCSKNLIRSLRAKGWSGGGGERTFIQIVLVTWPRWLPRPYRVKTFKNLLLQNQGVNTLKNWYVALGIKVSTNLLKR